MKQVYYDQKSGRRYYKWMIYELPDNGIFVFGSNTQGRHGAGAAKTARNRFGAVYGIAAGFQGKSYAIITKDLTKNVHPSVSRERIEYQIRRLYMEATLDPKMDFYVAYNGLRAPLNGYRIEDMAEMFACEEPPYNIIFEEAFLKLLISKLDLR